MRIKFQPLESNLGSDDNPHWFEISPYWPKEKEIKRIVEIMDELIKKKQNGSNIHNSVLELENIREYFRDPITHYKQTKSHTLGAKNLSQNVKVRLDGWKY